MSRRLQKFTFLNLLIGGALFSCTGNVQVKGTVDKSDIDADLIINDGAAYTDSNTLSLTLVASDAAQMRVGLNGNCEGSDWDEFAGTRSIALTEAQFNTTIVVSAIYRDKSGRFTECITKSIIHDGITPTAPTAVGFSAAISNNSQITFSWQAGTDADLAQYAYKICTAPDCMNGCTEETLTTATTGTESVTDTAAIFACVAAIDKAGHRSAFSASTLSAVVDTLVPVVNIGPNRAAGNSFTIRPTVTDATTLSYSWSMVSGPGTVTFGNASAKETLIDATDEGEYVIKLTATDLAGNATSGTFQLNWDRSLMIATGRSDVCTIQAGGVLRCWGRNHQGQLGYGDAVMRTSPPQTPVDIGTNRSALSVVVGSDQTCVVLDDGSVKCWGAPAGCGYSDGIQRKSPDANPIDLGTGRTALRLAAGWSATCAVLDNYTLKCWGTNTSGQLGYGDTQSRSVPDQNVDVGTDRTVRTVSFGYYSACALLDDGTVKCWGDNSTGQLGMGDITARYSPAESPIDFGAGLTVKKLAEGGRQHYCAIMSDDSIRCWGLNSAGQLGDGTVTTPRTTPVVVGGSLGGVPIQLGLGIAHSCALVAGGTVKCWGSNTRGGLGVGRQSSSCSNGVSTTLAACGAASGTWDGNLANECTNSVSTSQALCEASGGTWAHCSNWTKANSTACGLASKVWNPGIYNYCTNAAGTNLASLYCTNSGGHWASYTGYCADYSYQSKASCLVSGNSWFIGFTPEGTVNCGAGESVLAVDGAFEASTLNCVVLNDLSVKCWGSDPLSYGFLGYGDAYKGVTVSAPLNFPVPL